jgi:hypothetical protein
MQTMSWTNLVKGAINQVKDSGASTAIERWLTRELVDYGEVLDFKIRSADRQAEIRILLKGESEPLRVTIENYGISSEGPDDYITITRAYASREWVNVVLRKFLINKKHKIPAQYSNVAKLVLNG